MVVVCGVSVHPYTAGFVQARCMSSGSSKVVASAEAAVADIKDGSKL